MSLPDGLVLPRPSEGGISHRETVPAPTETAFTTSFGTLLPTAKFLATKHGRVAYYELAQTDPANRSPTRERILFVHGIQTPALGLLPLAKSLQDASPLAHMVLVDLYGHGLSDTPITPHTPNLFQCLIANLLDQLEWPSAHLVGYSFGGALTVGFAAAYPSRVQSFALIAPAGLMRSAQFESQHLRGDDEIAARSWVLETLEGGQLVVPIDWKDKVKRGEVVAEAIRQWQMIHHPGHAASVVAIFRDGGVMDSHKTFKKVSGMAIPNVSILGALDDVCNELDLIGCGFKNVSVVPHVGHGLVRERVDDVAMQIRCFWQEIGVCS